ncbi:MAG: hypothetical protein IIB77_04280 [Proteobacteria bacterium]|nr:hypothetical protein [Pseudomonadota bacterium]
MPNLLTQEDLEVRRTAAAFLPWVEECIEKIGSTNEGKSAIRFRQGLAKQLVEEALPIGIFAMHHFGAKEDIAIQLVVGNQNYDAIVTGDSSFFSYIEVTQAHEGEDAHLRMIALECDGHVSTLGPVIKTGTKATGISVEVEGIALSHSAVLCEELARIQDAVARKIDKSYPEDTALLVVFDDYISIRNEQDLAELRSAVEPLMPQLNNFRWFAVVGWSKRTFMEFDLSRS